MSPMQSMTMWIMQGLVVSLLFSFTPINIAFANPPPSATEVAAAETAVGDFYKWYLPLYVNDIDPLRRHSTDFPKYVSAALIRELEKKIHSRDGMDADYFLQAQDYLEDWPKEIHVATPSIKGKTATTIVTLGGTPESRYPLAVSLVKEKTGWKIRKVSMLPSTQ